MTASRRRFLAGMAAAPLANFPVLGRLPEFESESSDDLQKRLAADPLRPQCHLLPAKNWMNDPNGPIRWKGECHMFFQYNPNAAVWGDMHWAHAVSADMIHWRHLPVALAPTPGWDDADGCFTGSAVDDRGTATILYTGVKAVTPERATLRDGAHHFREVQCLATSSDAQLRKWNKWNTPVIQPPDDPMLTGFRDPFLWHDPDGWWYLGVGSGVRKQGGRVLLYRSRNLRQWEYLHPLASGTWTGHENINPVDSGEMWECPDFIALGKKFALLYATAGKVMWETGELDRKEMRFHKERSGVLDHGAYYAQKTQCGEPILWGWIPEARPEAEFSAAGWAGCMALPRALSLDEQGNLQMDVTSAAESLRSRHFDTDNEAARKSPEKRQRLVREIRIDEVAGEFQWKAASPGFSLTISDNTGAWWTLHVEREGAGTKLLINEKTIKIGADAAQELSCRLFLDASVAEFFCNRRHAVTTRIYRRPEGPLKVEISDAHANLLSSFQAWQLKPISKDRLTT